MSRFARLIGLGLLGIVLVVGSGVSGDKEKAEKDKGKKTHQLPTGWSKLNLTKEQKAKVYAIADDYNAKIAPLLLKIEALKEERLAEQIKVLTKDQKAKLLKGLTGDTESKEKTDK